MVLDCKLTIERVMELADQHPELHSRLLHPTEAGDYSPGSGGLFTEQLKHPKVVALGEIGLIDR